MTEAATSSVPSHAPQRFGRHPISLRCTLTRATGSPIEARTIEVGPTGMRVATERPLALDETVGFDLPHGDALLSGRARVICQERPDVYALRFGCLPYSTARGLREVVSRAAEDGSG
jgi:hypothetical protein